MGNSPINILKYGTDWYREPVAQADGDRPDEDALALAKDIIRDQALRIAELEGALKSFEQPGAWVSVARIAEIEAEFDRRLDVCEKVEEQDSAIHETELASHKVRIAELEAENASLKAKLAIPVKIVETSPGVFEGMGQRWPKA